MIQGLQDSGNSMLNRTTRQDVIANNIANSEVTGFKRDGLFTRELGDARRKGSGGHPVWREDKVAGAFIDFKQGSMRQTNDTRHLAIHGSGFFQVRTPQGDVYTRNGEFSVTGEGKLVTNLGMSVLDDRGGEIILDGPGWDVQENGEIVENGEVKAKLAIHDFEKDADGLYQDPDGVTRLERKPNGFFFPKPGVNRIPTPDDTRVMQGFLEESNINPITQMVDMLEVFRAFEADQRAIRMQNETLGRAVNDVGSIRV
jgi:flagellar basal-body rod protein FlgF